jgi:hypothetical protein
MNTEQLMDKLTKAVSFKYATDKTAPGVTVASLKKGYYCSVVRYDGAFARGKVVVCSAKGETLPLALKELANKFVGISAQPKNPMQELGDLVESAQ